MRKQPNVFAERGITEPGSNSKIWRYTSYSQLVNLIENKYLPLVSPLLFADKLEGAYSGKNLELFISTIQSSNADQGELQFHNLHHLHEDAHGFSENIYVTCWNVSDTENMLMWGCYSTLENGVAIVTSYSKLKSMFDDRFFIGNIKYYTPESELPVNPIERHFYKAKPYQGEQEVRVIYFDGPGDRKDLDVTNNFLKYKIDPEQFIESVQNLAATYNIQVQQSEYGNQAESKKLRQLLLDIYAGLKTVSNISCIECGGKGFIIRKSNVMFCTNCRIKDKWEKIKGSLMSKYR